MAPLVARLIGLVRPHHGHKRIVISVLAGIMLIWLIGLIEFAAGIPGRVEDTWSRTDAIVVLTGGSKRVEAGMALLAGGWAERMFISGVHEDVGVEDLIKLAPQAPLTLRCCIEIGHNATNTRGNAKEVAEWMNLHAFRSLRLVTSSYHMPRSLAEFRRVLPEVDIVPNPVFASDVKTDQWWKWPGTAALIVSEFNKYLLGLFR